MALQMVETICDMSIDYIEAKVADKITSVNGRSWKVPITLEEFVAIRLSDPDREVDEDFPVLYCTPDLGAVFSRAKGKGGRIETEYRVDWTVLVYHSGATATGGAHLTPAESVKRASIRYLLVVYELLQDMHDRAVSTYHVGGNPIDWGAGAPAAFEYGTTYTDVEAEEYLADATLSISCRHLEAI